MRYLKITVVSNTTQTTLSHSEIMQMHLGWKEDTLVQKWKDDLVPSQYGSQGCMTAYSKIKMTWGPVRLAFSNSQDIVLFFVFLFSAHHCGKYVQVMPTECWYTCTQSVFSTDIPWWTESSTLRPTRYSTLQSVKQTNDPDHVLETRGVQLSLIFQLWAASSLKQLNSPNFPLLWDVSLTFYTVFHNNKLICWTVKDQLSLPNSKYAIFFLITPCPSMCTVSEKDLETSSYSAEKGQMTQERQNAAVYDKRNCEISHLSLLLQLTTEARNIVFYIQCHAFSYIQTQYNSCYIQFTIHYC